MSYLDIKAKTKKKHDLVFRRRYLQQPENQKDYIVSPTNRIYSA